jgi:hypothetical protein
VLAARPTARRCRRFTWAFVTLAFAAPAASLPALATTLQHLDTRALALGSQQIVVGAVEDVHARWNDTHSTIVTDVVVRVTESVKGEAASRILLTQLGGEVNGVRVSIPGCPTFRAGEEALLFVWRDPRGGAQVTGLAQGKFEIERDPASGERYVQRRLPGFAVADAKSLRAVPAGTPVPRLRLTDFLAEIQRATETGHADEAR